MKSSRLIRVVALAGAFGGFSIGAFFLGLLLPFIYMAGGTRLTKRKRCQRVVGRAYRFFHFYMRTVELIDYRPQLALPASDAPRVLVANHPSLVDVTAILSAQPEVCCLVKSKIYRSPSFFLIMKFCGHICVDATEKRDGSGVIAQAVLRVEEGSDVLFFPEGTRSKGQNVGVFQPGAFAVAVHCESAVLPVSIRSSQAVLQRKHAWYQFPSQPVKLELKALPEIYPRERESSRDLTERVRETIVASLT